MHYEGTLRIRCETDPREDSRSYLVVFSPYRDWASPYPSRRVSSERELDDLLSRMGLPHPIVGEARCALSARRAYQAHWITIGQDRLRSVFPGIHAQLSSPS
jgi:hypothetical protein